MSVASDPAVKAAAVTKSDTTVLSCRALYVGGAGDVAVQMAGDPGGTTVTFTNVASGTILPVSAYRVMAATTASGIIALY